MGKTNCFFGFLIQRVGFLRPVILLLMMMLCANGVMAQNWKDGDVITIGSGDNYLTAPASGSAPTNSTGTTTASLWKVHLIETTQYAFESIYRSGYFLNANTTTLSLIYTNTPPSSTSYSYLFTLSNGNKRLNL